MNFSLFFKLYRIAYCWFLLATMIVSPAIAQSQVAGPFNPDNRHHPPSLPEYIPRQPGPEIVLPPPPVPDEKTLSTIPFVHVEHYRFEGNTVVPDHDLEVIARPYTGRKISSRDLFELRNAITRHYISKGYINSGAVLPDQKIVNGIITFRIIEGRLTDVDISGTKRIHNRYIQNRVDPGQDRPFNIIELQEKLQLLHQNPLIDRLDGQLSPGLSPGEASLNVRVTESNPFKLTAWYANDSSPPSGSTGPELTAQHLNISGRGDSFSGRFKHTRGTNEYAVRYSIPVNSHDTGISFFYDHQDSRIIESPFDLIDITSKSSSYGISLTHPFIKNLSQEFSVTLSGEKRGSRTFLFDQPYSFSDNIINGETHITAGRIAMDWNIYRPSEVFAIRSVLSFGLDMFDAGPFIFEPDGEFTSWLGQVQWSRRLDMIPGDLFVLKSSVQLSNDVLPSLERFAVGGFNTVRGYRENQFVRDNGLVASAEYRFPVARIPVPKISRDLKDGVVYLAPFFDWGRSWNKDDHSGAATIFSIGTGIRWDMSRNLQARVYWGKKLKDIDVTGNDLQDSGVYFSIRWDIL